MVNVAVVTPVFNTQDYLHRCIDSILSQKGVSLQHFIIDDGSTDNSAQIAQHYQNCDSRVTFIKKANEGQGAARNIGIKLADAEYIYFVDSDDYLGEDALSILYEAAKEKKLDICSPDVPSHYFEKPLEYVGCVPCKSQFIRLELIRRFNLMQPPIRSGQDGVFSHLVLTHCNRIGMAKNAKFHYTHAREGSTFAAHLKRHDLVPTLLRQHYDSILAHYDKFDLWQRNSLRLLAFMADESLRNRLDPHFPYLDTLQRTQCIELLSRVTQRAYANLSEKDRQYVPASVKALATKPLADLVSEYEAVYANKPFARHYPKDGNLLKDQVYICKYADTQLSPPPHMDSRITVAPQPAPRQLSQPRAAPISEDMTRLQHEVRLLRGKLDLAINSINNSATHLASVVRTPASTLASGNKNIVVSLTTLPHRLPLVHYAIESIFSQTMLPSRIVLWITNKIQSRNFLTPQLKALMARGLEIHEVEDVGPHTKLVYALEAHPDKCVISVDDDIVYPINTIQCLWDQHTKHPSAVVCNWARELCFDAEGKVRGVRAGKLLTPPTLELELEQSSHFRSEPSLLAFAYGTSGVLYPPKSLSPKVFDVETFRKLCPKEDDIWFKAMALLNNTPTVPTNLGINPSHHCITGSQSEALRHDNHGLQQNEAQMQRVFSFFNLYEIIRSPKIGPDMRNASDRTSTTAVSKPKVGELAQNVSL